MPSLAFTTFSDSYIDSVATANNFGNDSPLLTGWSNGGTPRSLRSLFLFNILVIPAGSTITAAELRLKTSTPAASGSAAKVYRVTNGWVENQVSWIKRTEVGWLTPGGDFLDDETAVAFTLPTSGDKTITGLAALVQEILDGSGSILNILLKRVTESGTEAVWQLYSRESEGNEPTLTVDYTPVSTRDNTLIALDGRMQNMTGGMQ